MKAHSYRPIDPKWTGGPERLQKLLARAGFGSRRVCETLIAEGRVAVDGIVKQELGVKADPSKHDVRVDHERITLPERMLYLVHKPQGYLCTNDDELGRRKELVLNLVPEPQHGRLFTIGRLDKDSVGLVLVTNDGELCQQLSHPSFQVPKTYRVVVRGDMPPQAIRTLMEGVWLAEGRVKPESIKVKKRGKKSSSVEVVLTEGINREIRRLFAKVNHPVSRLERTAIGMLQLGDLKPGEYRRLEHAHIEALFEMAARYRKLAEAAARRDRAKLEADKASEGKGKGEGEPNAAPSRPRPKPELKARPKVRRDEFIG